MSSSPRRAVVCGTKFGRIYLQAFRQPGLPFELAGIVGLGSERTRRCADTFGVPVFRSVDEIPDHVEAACVVVGGSVGGGQGAELAQRLMRRGLHVLQEHPLLPAELADCLRTAASQRVQYHLNTHYVTIEPVRRFIEAAQRLSAYGKPAFIDASCSIQVAYTLFDILGEALSGLRPWGFAAPAEWPEALSRMAGGPPAYRTLEGVLAGIPFTLRIQNELDPQDPDNYSHHLHRITIGSAGGCLTLVDTHGPVVWTPRLHLPASAAALAEIHAADDPWLDHVALTQAVHRGGMTHRDVLRQVWPGGVATALTRFAAAIDAGSSPLARGQYQLAVCELWQHVTRLLGFPLLRPGTTLPPLPEDAVLGPRAPVPTAQSGTHAGIGTGLRRAA